MLDWHGWTDQEFWWLLGFAFIVIMIWLLFFYRGSRFRKRSNKSPLEILKARFARGEISKEEFKEAKKAIHKD